MSYDISDVLQSSGPQVPAWPKLQIGQSIEGVIEFVGEPYARHDEPKYNQQNKSHGQLKIVLGGGAIYPKTHSGPAGRVATLAEMEKKPDFLMQAIGTAVKAATPPGQPTLIEVGGYLKITRVADYITKAGMTAHNYEAEYRPAPKGYVVPDAEPETWDNLPQQLQVQQAPQPVQQAPQPQWSQPQPQVAPTPQTQPSWPQQAAQPLFKNGPQQ